MCGLTGIVSTVPQQDREWLQVARDSLAHRGPDDAGEWWSPCGRVGFAHRRLSILDLSPVGHQPMHLDELGLSIVFNGEIYNFGDLRRELEACGHVFRSHSDTEVLLLAYAEWGTECLSRLTGMFAFALYDAKSQRCFFARDRAGEKPLFYSIFRGNLWFASELKALLTHPMLPRRIDRTALDCYLATGYVPGERCILDGFHKLPAAHALTFDLQSGVHYLWRYWQMPPFEAGWLDSRVSARMPAERVLLDELDVVLEDAVGRQLVADVPVGILLSGGVDSSLVTAMAARRSRQVCTFSLGFPGHRQLDETPHARLVARHFGTKHTELMVDPATADLIPRLARQFDEPMADTSMIPTFLLTQLVRQHCAVALGGDGGDELFGGYDYYSRLQAIRPVLAGIPRPLRHAAAWCAENWLPVGFKGRGWLQAHDVDLERGLPSAASYFDAPTRCLLMQSYGPWKPSAAEVFRIGVPTEADLVQRATRMDFMNYLADDILVKVDRASMLSSLEVRAPLLDSRVIEFAYRCVPSQMKATPAEKKILLKRLTERLLPTEFDRQRKQGFSIPLGNWLKAGPFRTLFWDTLSHRDSLFDRRTVAKLLRGQDRGFRNSERLFALVLFELWRESYGIQL